MADLYIKPTRLQLTKYQTQDGTLYDSVIINVGNHSDDNRYWNVRAIYLVPEDGPYAERSGVWIYDAKVMRVLWHPCGPPFP